MKEYMVWKSICGNIFMWRRLTIHNQYICIQTDSERLGDVSTYHDKIDKTGVILETDDYDEAVGIYLLEVV